MRPHQSLVSGGWVKIGGMGTILFKIEFQTGIVNFFYWVEGGGRGLELDRDALIILLLAASWRLKILHRSPRGLVEKPQEKNFPEKQSLPRLGWNDKHTTFILQFRK